MNLKSLIRDELWNVISRTYETQNYSHAVVDSIHYLTDVIREKADVDGDGAKLIGKAFGGTDPKIKVNKFQTETEKNIQKGIESMLRGIYSGIRNPRSHEQITDSKEDADSIILFINYLLSIIAASEERFTISKFLNRVFDSNFAENERYALLLYQEIPVKKRFDALVEIYRERHRKNGRGLKYMIQAIFPHLSMEKQKEFIRIASEDAKEIQNEQDVIILLQILRPSQWVQIEEAARIRLENMILKSMKRGEMERDSQTKVKNGALSTWATDFFSSFSLHDELVASTIELIKSNNENKRRFFSHFFLHTLENIFKTDFEKKRCIEAIDWATRQGGTTFNSDLKDFLSDTFASGEWREALLETLENATDEEDPRYYLPDGTPFLGKIREYDDCYDIPF